MANGAQVAAAGRLLAAGFTSKGASEAATETAIKRYYGRQSPLPFRNFCGGMADGYDDYAPALPEALAEVGRHPGLILQFNTLGGMITRGTEGAYPHRARRFLCEVQAYWESPRNRDPLVAATARIREQLGRVASAHYRNYPCVDFPDGEQAYYGASYPRLKELKLRYDPRTSSPGLAHLGCRARARPPGHPGLRFPDKPRQNASGRQGFRFRGTWTHPLFPKCRERRVGDTQPCNQLSQGNSGIGGWESRRDDYLPCNRPCNRTR